MAFNAAYFQVIALNRSINRRVYLYRTTDVIATITGSSYFAGIGSGGAVDFDAQVGDIIEAQIVDDYGAPTTLVGSTLVIYEVTSGTASALGAEISASLDADLLAIAALSSTGIAVRSASNTWVQRTLANAAAGIAWTNGDGVAGNPTPVLANDLAALEGLASTGIAVRSTTDTWVQRTLTGTANEITATNGDGVAANPTVSLPTALTFTGKTVTGGTLNPDSIKTPSTTVAGLTAAATAGAGARSFVTDATATTFLSVVAGTGANAVPVVSDGTNWLIG